MGRVKEINSKIIKVKTNVNRHKKNGHKMPNFEAIHKKQFKQMESIFDHVARKVERAKELSKSTVKKSGKKTSTTLNEVPTNNDTKDAKFATKMSQSQSGSVKARQKINFTKTLSVDENSNSNVKNYENNKSSNKENHSKNVEVRSVVLKNRKINSNPKVSPRKRSPNKSRQKIMKTENENRKRLFNELPDYIKKSSSINTFTKRVIMYKKKLG